MIATIQALSRRKVHLESKGRGALMFLSRECNGMHRRNKFKTCTVVGRGIHMHQQSIMTSQL